MHGQVLFAGGIVGSGVVVAGASVHPLLQLLLQGAHIHQIMQGMQGMQGVQGADLLIKALLTKRVEKKSENLRWSGNFLGSCCNSCRSWSSSRWQCWTKNLLCQELA